MKLLNRALRWAFLLLLVAGYLACLVALFLSEERRPRFEFRVLSR